MTLRDPRSLRRSERGQALVETALVLPVFLVLVLGIVDFGNAYQQFISVSGAAREGARLGIAGAPASAITDRAKAAARELTVVVQVTNACGTAGTPLLVQVERAYKPITPLGQFVSGVGDGFSLRATADMRLEQTGC
ncbi:MAG: pilus assembly protein [Dehalococcoidia bacterium]|nr:MAG: pilus assembly protein [Dehalococcoidia bacterium]